jgi:hypothetical protein
LVEEVVGFRRPLLVSGERQHSCHISLQNDSELVPIRLQRDRLDESSNRLVRFGTKVISLFKRHAEPGDLGTVKIGHTWMQKRLRLWRLQLTVEIEPAAPLLVATSPHAIARPLAPTA